MDQLSKGATLKVFFVLQVEDIVQFYCSSYRYTKAYAHVHKLELQGFQAGCLMSGNMRNRVVRNLSSGWYIHSLSKLLHGVMVSLLSSTIVSLTVDRR